MADLPNVHPIHSNIRLTTGFVDLHLDFYAFAGQVWLAVALFSTCPFVRPSVRSNNNNNNKNECHSNIIVDKLQGSLLHQTCDTIF